MSIHDEMAIQKTIALQGPDARLGEPLRTTSFLQFFAKESRHMSEKPYVSKIPPLREGQAQINFGGAYHQVMLSDIAGCEDRFSLDVDGFEFALGAYDPDAIGTETYIDSMAHWLQQHLGCSEVFVFDCVTRHENQNELRLKDCSDVARRVHCGRYYDGLLATHSTTLTLSKTRHHAQLLAGSSFTWEIVLMIFSKAGAD